MTLTPNSDKIPMKKEEHFKQYYKDTINKIWTVGK